MDTEEMYRQGVADAERGEPHPFYYQHYYHYRRGYDRTRRRLRRWSIDGVRGSGRGWLLLALLLVVGVGFGARYFMQSRSGQEQLALAVGTPPTSTATPEPPTRAPIFPTAVPSPTPVVLRVEGSAVVTNMEGQALRGRSEPNLKAAVTVRFKNGEQVRILEGPVDADGYSWWRIEGASGTGWSAQQSPEGIVWLQPFVEQ